MKVVFLDIDGVMNSFRTLEVYGNYKTFDPVAVRQMNILDDLGVKFVLSSTWRLYNRKLAETLIGFDFYDATPVLGDEVSNCRGDDVEWWMKNKGQEVTHYCCVDDGSDFYDHQNLVRTTNEEGLTRAHFWDILRKLDLVKEFEDYLTNRPKDHY